MGSIIGKNLIEVDNDQIRVVSQKRKIIKSFDLDNIDKLILKGNVSKFQENEYKAKPVYFTIFQGDITERLDFKVDSHYMIKQLNKVLEHWRTKGYNFEEIA